MGLKFGKRWQSQSRIDGKTVVITGANTGVGYFTALDLYKRGGRIILACRNRDKAIQAAENIKQSCSESENVGELRVLDLDLSSLRSVRNCAHELLNSEESIHFLINNAGVVLSKRELTEDGYEKHFATNHLGHFLLTLLLLPRLVKSAPSRIINLTSEPHCIANKIQFDDINCEKFFFYHTAYSQTKLANVLFSNELARRLKIAGVNNVTVCSVNPGGVDTQMSEKFANMILPGVGWMYSRLKWMFMDTGKQGALTTAYCVVAEETARHTGQYYTNCQLAEPPTATKSEKMSTELWNRSLEMTYLDRNLDFVSPA